MECEEDVYSNDYLDIIMEYTLRERGNLVNKCVQRVSDIFDIAYLPRVENLALNIQN